jgi:hypothetical protein
MVLVPSALTSICVVLPVTSALMVPFNGKYRINVVAHGSEMVVIGAEQLATHITDLQTKLRIEQTEQGRIASVVVYFGNITVVWVFFG